MGSHLSPAKMVAETSRAVPPVKNLDNGATNLSSSIASDQGKTSTPPTKTDDTHQNNNMRASAASNTTGQDKAFAAAIIKATIEGKSKSSSKSKKKTKKKKSTSHLPATTAKNSSPQIVENTLKDFHTYLQDIKENLHLQQTQERKLFRQEQQRRKEIQDQQQSQRLEQQYPHAQDDNRNDDDTLNTCGDYSWYKQQPSNHCFTNNNIHNNGNDEAILTFWTETDTSRYIHRLEAFQKVVTEQMDRFPLQSQTGRDIMETMQVAVARCVSGSLRHSKSVALVLRHVSQMAISVSKLLQEIQLVDLDKLIYLMKHNQQAGMAMANKDVILLCGAARSGKTTTLHYMAGSKLEEVEVEGFFHLQPTRVKQAALAHYKTACSDREAVTKHLQTVTVRIQDGTNKESEREVVICDTPGLGNGASLSDNSVELDIANGLGMVRSLHRAKTIKPVFVLSRDEVRVRERFSAFDGETVACISRLLCKSQDVDLSPLNYVFTKYEEKHRDCLCKQFSVMGKNHIMNSGGSIGAGNIVPSSSSCKSGEDETVNNDTSATRNVQLMHKVLNDIAKKTTPNANIVLPLEGKHEEFVQHVWDTSHTVQVPAKFFVPFVSFAALKKLQLQLRITLSDLRTSLVEEDHVTAVYRLRQLQDLASVLPEAKDCASLGEEAVRRHMATIRERIMASLERKDTSMAIHRSHQLVTLSEVLPEAKVHGTVTYDSVMMLRDLNQALKSIDYTTSHNCMSKLLELSQEFPEATKCSHFALKASVHHVSEFRGNVANLVSNILGENTETQEFTSLLGKLRTEMSNVVHSEPLLSLCVKSNFEGVDKDDVVLMSQLAQSTGENFCVAQVQRLTDHMKKNLPNFRLENIDMQELLKEKASFLTAIERLKIISVELRATPAGTRAESIYHLAFQDFHDFLSSILKEAEDKYRSAWTDLDAFGLKLFSVAVLLQGPLKNKPHTKRREHFKIEELERRVLKLMLRLEIEITRSTHQLKTFQFPDCDRILMKHNSAATSDFGIAEMKAPRFLLIAVAKNARIRKMLPRKVDVLETNVCIAMFDHALLNFWKRVVIRLEQDYAVVVAMQKLNKNPAEILPIAKMLQTDISRVEKEFLNVCGWSDDITTESESDLKRLIAVRDCVQAGVAKLEVMLNSHIRGMGLFTCAELNNVSDTYFCKPSNPHTE